jgi:ribosome-associated protein YbcJ (S4-like RNA binding protein)
MWSDFQYCGSIPKHQHQLQERGVCKSGSRTKQIPFDGKMKKNELHEIIKLKKLL